MSRVEVHVPGTRDGLLTDARALFESVESSYPALKPQIDQFVGVFASVGQVKAGQVVAIDYTPGTGTQVSLDGAAKGTIPGEAFNRALMKVWLGDNPVQESLKKALLGAG